MHSKDGWAAEAGRGVTAVDGSTKAKIERAALVLFAQRGVDGVSVKEIASHAGISNGAMYRYFPSKYKLAQSLMLAIHNRLSTLVREIEASDIAFKNKVKNLVAAYCTLADDDWSLFSYHLLHLHHFPKLFAAKPGGRKKQDSPVTACADMLSAAMKAGDIRSGNKELLASMALGVVIQAAQSKVYGRLKGPLLIYAPEFEKAVWAIVLQK